MGGNRDDFSAMTKERLAKRVSYHCSNPHCRKLTCGPGSSDYAVMNIGVAAHICAAAQGGKRYDSNMSHEERKDISNGIWLCQSCAKLIDSDENRYTIELLHFWKEQAEEEVLQRLEGKQFEPVHIPIFNYSELYDEIESCDSRDKADKLSYQLSQEVDRLVATLEEIQQKIIQNEELSNAKWCEIYNAQFESKLFRLRSLDGLVRSLQLHLWELEDHVDTIVEFNTETELVTVEYKKQIPQGGGGRCHSYDLDKLPVKEIINTDKARRVLHHMGYAWEVLKSEIERYNQIQTVRRGILSELGYTFEYDEK